MSAAAAVMGQPQGMLRHEDKSISLASPLASPSTFFTQDVTSGLPSALYNPLMTLASNPGASAAFSQLHSMGLMSMGSMGMLHSAGLDPAMLPPASPFGLMPNTNSPFLQADGAVAPIYSPTAIRSPAAAAALFARDGMFSPRNKPGSGNGNNIAVGNSVTNAAIAAANGSHEATPAPSP